MRILSWNLRGAAGIKTARAVCILAAVEEVAADVLLLQEVPLEGDFIDRLCKAGHQVTDTARASPDPWGKRHAALVVARHPLFELERPPGLRIEGHFAAARVGALELASCHIPNGRGHAAKARQRNHPPDIKVVHLEAALQWLQAAPGRLLAGDFNEPDRFEGNPCRAVAFRSSRREYQPRQDAAIQRLFNLSPEAHLCRHLHDPDLPPTHVVRGRPVWFDHAFVHGIDGDWRVKYLHHLRGRHEAGTSMACSDHSPLFLEYREP